MADFFGLGRDLLGDPIDPGMGRSGRPRHLATDARRAMVAQLHAEGRSQREIAQAIGCTEPTLRLHYHEELESTSQTWRRHQQ